MSDSHNTPIIMIKRAVLFVVLPLILTSCTSLSAQQSFQDVALTIQERTGKNIRWDGGSPEDQMADGAVERLLRRPLTLSSSTQIALLNNRSLQSTYNEIGIAQADLVQAGLLKNPVFDASFIDPTEAGAPVNLAFGVVFQFIDALYIPLRKRVAASRLEEVKFNVAGQVVDHAAMTQSAFVDYLAARQLVELFRKVTKGARASFEAATILRKAGNITDLRFETEQSQLTQAKLDLAEAEAMQLGTREKLNTLMGLSGKQTRWRAGRRLPGLRGTPSMRQIEKQAIDKSLGLAEARQRIETLAHKYGVTRATSLIPDLEIGFERERDGTDKEWSRGPTFDLVLPIFDQGQARRKKAELEIRRAQDIYWDMAVKVRSSARTVRNGLVMGRKKVVYYKRAVLPQMQKILSATRREYNGMQTGVFRLLLAKRGQIQGGQRYIQALQSYWQTVIAYRQLMSGRMPSGGGSMGSLSTSSAAAEGGGH